MASASMPAQMAIRTTAAPGVARLQRTHTNFWIFPRFFPSKVIHGGLKVPHATAMVEVRPPGRLLHL